LARQLGRVDYFTETQTRELLDLKQRLGFDDPRFHVESCDLCGNSAFREGYKERPLAPKAFEPAPDYPGYLQAGARIGDSTAAQAGSGTRNGDGFGADVEQLVQSITDQVYAALGAK
jgi:L-fuculose-phosphate aldolase